MQMNFMAKQNQELKVSSKYDKVSSLEKTISDLRLENEKLIQEI